MLRIIILGLTGALLHVGVWIHLAIADNSVLTALIGLTGSALTASALIFAAYIARDTKRGIENVNRKVSAPRRISATAGEDSVVIQPPEVDD